MARFTIKMDVEPQLPYDFCDKCKMFKLRTDILYENDKPFVFADCENSGVCINVIKLAKEADYEY